MYVITAMYSNGDHKVVKVLPDSRNDEAVQSFVREHLIRSVREFPAYAPPPPIGYKTTEIDEATGEPNTLSVYVHYVNQGMLSQMGIEAS